MLAHRFQRWPNIKPALRQRLVFTGLLAHTATHIYWPVIGRCLAVSLAAMQHCWLTDQPVASEVGWPSGRWSLLGFFSK